MPFDSFYDLIVEPYAHHFRTARILISEPSLSDFHIARILTASNNLTSLMLYHANFQNPFMLTSWKFPEGSKEEAEAMDQTNQAIISSMTIGSLNSIGIYSQEIIIGNYWRRYKMPSAALFSLFSMIADSANANASLKHLEIVLPTMPNPTYDLI